jgi:hypothetical protein
LKWSSESTENQIIFELSIEENDNKIDFLFPRKGFPITKARSKIILIIKKMPKDQGHRNHNINLFNYINSNFINYINQIIHFIYDKIQL